MRSGFAANRGFASRSVATRTNTLGRVAELADAQDLKSCVPLGTYGFEPRPGYFFFSRCCPDEAGGILRRPMGRMATWLLIISRGQPRVTGLANCSERVSAHREESRTRVKSIFIIKAA